MTSPNVSDFQRLAAELDGALHFDATMRKLYATDASVYREMPQAVALPRTEEDIRKLVASRANTAHRSYPGRLGTSLAGQVVGSGIVVDVRAVSLAFWRLMPPAARGAAWVVRNELNLVLAPHGVFFAPETSTRTVA
jgi:FAD/FMN-containing dehydrogenase